MTKMEEIESGRAKGIWRLRELSGWAGFRSGPSVKVSIISLLTFASFVASHDRSVRNQPVFSLLLLVIHVIPTYFI